MAAAIYTSNVYTREILLYAALHVLFLHAGKTCTRRGPTFRYGLALELLRIELSH